MDVEFYESMIDMYEKNAENCKPSRFSTVTIWVYKILTGWFFLFGILDWVWLNPHWYWGAFQWLMGCVWIFNTRTLIRTRNKQAERRAKWERQAEEMREDLTKTDPTHRLANVVIEEEP